MEFFDQSWTQFWSIPELEFLCLVIAYLQGFLSLTDAVKGIIRGVKQIIKKNRDSILKNVRRIVDSTHQQG